MFFSSGEEARSVLSSTLILIPSAFYTMGLMQGKTGHYFFRAGIILHLLSIIERGLAVGALPLTEKHDNISFMAFVMALIYLDYSGKNRVKEIDVTILPLIAVFMFIALAHHPLNTISPFLKSPWFYLHIFFYFTSYAYFGIAACIGLHYILSGQNDFDALQYKAIVYGWVMLSISLVAGSIWFYVAYGTYWLWTSKELWITITWTYYGLYLHARYIKGLNGRPVAVVGSLGFVVAVFTYFGVGTVIPCPPTQF